MHATRSDVGINNFLSDIPAFVVNALDVDVCIGFDTPVDFIVVGTSSSMV